MSSRAQHYREAERLLATVAEPDTQFPPGGMERMLYRASVHAELATVGDQAYQEYLDLMSMERGREVVASTPEAGTRDWLRDVDEPDWLAEDAGDDGL